MMPIAAMRLRRDAPGVAQSVFSSTLKESGIVLSNGGRTADSTTLSDAGGIVLSDSARASGKYYIEFVLSTVSGSGRAVSAGLAASLANVNTYLGSDADAFGSWVEGPSGSLRSTYNNGSQVLRSSSQPSPSVGDRMRLAVDLEAGSLWLGLWGSSAWAGGGDPAAGTSPTYTFTQGPMRFAANPRSTGNAITLSDPGAWLYGAPSGFVAWPP